jgi:hypothetical protein
MTKHTDKEIRELMYGKNDDSVPLSNPKTHNIKITESQKTIVVEKGGVKYQLPSIKLIEGILKENTKLKSEILQTRADMKKLTEAIQKMDADLRIVERELHNKADIYGEN